jgi:Family of unknown function (DUF5677)
VVSIERFKLTFENVIDAGFDGTKYMHDFSRDRMLPVLKTLLSPTPQEIAVRDTYYKMVPLLQTSFVMNTSEHFQSIASPTRSLFELWFDLKILAQDTTGEEVRKYNEFPEIERYRTAEQMVKFVDAHPQALRMDISKQRAFYDDPERARRIANVKARRKDGRLPTHWTDKDVLRRAQSVGLAAKYVEAYPLLSWYVHAGAAGTAGMDRRAIEAIIGFCHGRIHEMFVDATKICANVTKIANSEYFDGWIRDIEQKTGDLILQEQIRLLKANRKQPTQ